MLKRVGVHEVPQRTLFHHEALDAAAGRLLPAAAVVAAVAAAAHVIALIRAAFVPRPVLDVAGRAAATMCVRTEPRMSQHLLQRHAVRGIDCEHAADQIATKARNYIGKEYRALEALAHLRHTAAHEGQPACDHRVQTHTCQMCQQGSIYSAR